MTKSGVNPNLYSIYDFQDHLWTTTNRDDLLELTNRCVAVGGQFWFKLPNSDVWVVRENINSAIKQAMNTWLNGRLANGSQISSELIQTFFNGIEESSIVIKDKIIKSKDNVGSCPMIEGRMVIPYGPRYVTYNNRQYLNVAEPNIISGDRRHENLGRAILRMVYRALCNGPELNYDPDVESAILLEQVMCDKYTQLEFRFVMNWLAAIVQAPGVNLQTNLWLLGQQEGIGKGTLIEVLRAILGRGLVGALNQTEIEAGWNDHLFGKALVEVNEFDSANSKITAQGWNKWVKANTCEPELLIRQRNITAFTTLHIGNFLFTSNDEMPIYLDTTDRRNMIVETSSDPIWKSFASEIKRALIIEHKDDVAAGFAWILEQVKVDMALIMSAPITQLKSNIQSGYLNSVEEWIANDESVVRGVFMKARDLYLSYKSWYGTSHSSNDYISETKWGIEMGKLVKRSQIEKSRNDKGVMYMIPKSVVEKVKIDNLPEARSALSSIIGKKLDAVDYDAVVEKDTVDFSKMSKLDRMRARMRVEDSRNTQDGHFDD